MSVFIDSPTRRECGCSHCADGVADAPMTLLDTMRARDWLRQHPISCRGGRLSWDHPNRRRGVSSASLFDEPPAFNPAARVRWLKDL